MPHMSAPVIGKLGDKGMLQYKRMFVFIPLSIILPALSVAILVLVFSRFDIATTDISFLTTSYITGSAFMFVVFWWFARGLIKKPYLHAFIMYLCSLLIATTLIVSLVGKDYIFSISIYDALITIIVVFVATTVGYKNKEVSSNVS